MPQDGDVQLPYVYRVTKYDPADRDEHGHYTGAEDSVSDHGVLENAYLQAVEAFAAEAGIDRLSVREPQVPSLAHFGTGRPQDDFGLAALFPTGLAGFHDGADVPLAVGLELTRLMLRESGAWCRLEWEDAFAVHVGWDQYLYVGSRRPGGRALARTRALGLFPERLDASPYAMETSDEDIVRPGDDAFWAGVHWAVASGRAGALEETYLEGATRWHRLTRDTVDAVRSRIAPRARLAVWPHLSSDTAAVLDALPAEGLVEGVWEDESGRIRSAIADETEFPQLTARISGAVAAMLLSGYADTDTATDTDAHALACVPLFTAVMPDSDGVLRARWRPEPTASDRNWDFIRTLRRGDIISGTVIQTADFGVTFVDIGGPDGSGSGKSGGGFAAIINIPELSWRPLSHPSDVVSVGQVIDTEILDIDLVRERVSLSLKALHEDPLPLLAEQTGRTIVGQVTKVIPFGVFVRIEDRDDGLEGLVHNSELSAARPDTPQPALQVGDSLLVKILDVDPTRRRITLSHRQAVETT
ncbi:S1 RNA-binding domain-containing protein [Streptomyces sp. NPDC093510]|uniref:S1 RNA-binding domain-containing protein n=1 Tax=Streptomyces sp. NPDC093510 TaxID=3155199 RepID=UPI00343641E2